MHESIDPQTADKRTVSRYIQKGLIDEKAYEKHLKSLPDLADKAAPVQTIVVESQEEAAEA
ncbi:MAG: hypothetical protein ACOZIN_13360 [Myxococcota bacterium]